MAIDDTIKEANDKTNCVVKAYADDIVICGSRSKKEIRDSFNFIHKGLAKIGLRLS